MLPAELPKKRKTYEALIEDRNVVKSVKVLRDRIGKRTESVMAMQRQLQLTYEQIKMTWPPRDELQKIVQGLEAQLKTIGKCIDEIEDDAEQGVLTEPDAKKKLIEAEGKLNDFKVELQKARKGLNQITQELEKTRRLDTIFTNSMNHSPEHLREELSSVFPIGIRKLDCIGVNHDHGSLPTLDDLLTKLYDESNNIVGIPDFEGLQEALKMAAWGETPGYLEHIAIEIETAIGKRIEIPHIRVLLSAAIKEMKDLKVEELEGDMFKRFKKWAATLNHAKKKGFYVNFAYISWRSMCGPTILIVRTEKAKARELYTAELSWLQINLWLIAMSSFVVLNLNRLIRVCVLRCVAMQTLVYLRVIIGPDYKNLCKSSRNYLNLNWVGCARPKQ